MLQKPKSFKLEKGKFGEIGAMQPPQKFEKPIEGIFPNCDFQNFTNNLLFISLIYSENLIYLS